LEAGADSTPAALSLVNILEIAALNSRDYQSQKEQLYLEALDLTLERWRYASRPFATLTAAADGASGGDDSVSVDGELGFTRLLGSGASIVASIGTDLFRIVSSGDGWDAITDISLSITQPLLRGAGRAIAREPLTQAERDLIYQVRAFERYRRTFAVETAQRFYDLLEAIDELHNEEGNYDNLTALRTRNEALAAAGRLSDIEADQAHQDELRSETRLISLRAALQRQRDQFNLFLGLPVGTQLDLDQEEFTRLNEGDGQLAALDEKAAIALALDTRLDLLTVRDGLEDGRRQVELARDALRAGLSLDASLNATEDGTSWSAGLALDGPLDRLAERNAYRAQLISLAAAERDLVASEDSIVAGVRDALRGVGNSRQSHAIQRGAVHLARRRVESAQLNLDAGRASTRDWLEAREALLEAENAASAALIDYTLARLDLYLQLEVLVVDSAGLHAADELLKELDS
ncbi:MAG: TolC family protein, partial [Planctomycetota bacterium]|nr:TolC family protein [Planctomycetota bacterium]